MLDGVKARAFRKHPPRENSLFLARQLDFVDLDEGGRVRRLGRRTRVAHARRHLQRPEVDRVIDLDLEMRDAARDLVERGKYGDRILERFGVDNARGLKANNRKCQQDQRITGRGRLIGEGFSWMH
jgi:hypothetical protein